MPAPGLRYSIALLALFFASAIPCVAQLDRALEVHGGRAKWQKFASVEYDVSSASSKGARVDHQVFDLRTRAGLITSDKYTLGVENGQVWIRPGLDALDGTPPRFYMWTPFYFFGMPFVFSDPGASAEALGKKTVGNREYDAAKITFRKGTGDTPDDFYVAYFDPQTAQLKLASYVVTFPKMRKGRPIEQLEQHAIVFEEWQQAEGLLVPKTAPFYKWVNGNVEGEALGKLEFSNVHFSETPPDPTKFQKPADAVFAPLE